MENTNEMKNVMKNEGYNYYYGVSDNEDLIHWMRDIDSMIDSIITRVNTNTNNIKVQSGELKRHIDILQDHERVINTNADILDASKAWIGVSLACLGIGGIFTAIMAYAALCQSEENAQEIEMVKKIAARAVDAAMAKEKKEKEE